MRCVDGLKIKSFAPRSSLRVKVGIYAGDGDGTGDGVGVAAGTALPGFTNALWTKNICVGVRNARPLLPQRTRLVGVPLRPEIVTEPSGKKVLMSKARSVVVPPKSLKKKIRPAAESRNIAPLELALVKTPLINPFSASTTVPPDI